MTEATRQNFQARGSAAGFPIVTLMSGSRRFEGAEGWSRLLEPGRTLTPADVADIERQLADAEQRQADRLPHDAAEAEREARRSLSEQPLAAGDFEYVEMERMRANAAELAARDAGPATHAQVAELISVTRDVLAELRKR